MKEIEIFRIYKRDGEIAMDARWNSKDLEEGDIEKIDDLIELWKRLTFRSESEGQDKDK